MEPLVEANLSEESGILNGVVEKRRALEDDDVVLLGSPPKRIKEDREGNMVAVGDVKKVAEMVLVLSAMGKMRGGMEPTEAEKELMTEARQTLVKICQGFAPKDVFPWDAFGGVIEDLGLNKLKEHRLGFRPPKISIAEKLLISKRKMEKAEDFSLPTTPHSSQYLRGNSAPSAESHFSMYPGRTSTLDKPVHMSISSGSVQFVSPLAQGTTTVTQLPYQLPTSEIRPMSSTAVTSSHLGSAALPRSDRSHLRSDGRPNGSLHTSVAQANTTANTTMRTPTWSVQSQSVLSAKNRDNKVTVEAAIDTKSGVVPHGRSMAVNAQSTAGLPSHGTQGPLMGNNHAEICKVVKKLLYPRGFERPTWNPPSMDYMNNTLTCQMCMSTITEIDNVLVCDGCEKGYHLKCLQTINQKGVPRGEWHCRKCLSLSNGKSLPPKYGRVMRNTTITKVSASSTAVPANLSKNDGGSGTKTEHPNAVSNGNTSQKVSTEVEVNILGHQIVGHKGGDGIELKEDYVNPSSVRTSNNLLSGDTLKNLTKIPNSNSDLSTNSLTENTSDEKVVQTMPNPTAKLEIISDSLDCFEALTMTQDGGLNLSNSVANQNTISNHIVSTGSCQPKHEVVNDNPADISGNSEGLDQDRSHLHSVTWVGDPIQTLVEKTYYSSCCVNEHTYKTMDHILIRFDGERLLPARLQAMWEDNNARSKWVTVNRCYFPGDLPEGVGRPCGLESSEVYESSCGTMLMAGLIENPCQVLPPRRFAEENEKRTASGMQLQMPPLYLCKWIYDEAKGLFRDVSC